MAKLISENWQSNYSKFKKPIFCPNSACFGYNKTQVEMGDFIQVKTNPNSDALTLGREGTK